MKKLTRYHKQGFPKEVSKQLMSLNKRYDLKFKKNVSSYISIMIFKEGLYNKQQIEKTFERFRNNHLDMWENMEFNERNLLLMHELDPMKESLTQFTFEGSTIFIPFFDVLMNNLYERKTAILELPQFFKLYKDFNASIIDMGVYGDLPLKHKMSEMEYITKQDDRMVVYYPKNRTFYVFENNKVQIFPFYIKSSLTKEMQEVMADLILSGDDKAILDKAKYYKILSPKLMRRHK